MTVIVGAGLGGLACAAQLHRAGHAFVLIEARGEPGGRLRTEVTPDGFHLDHGFQVILESYPTVRELLPELGFRPAWFESGALLADAEQGLLRMLNPCLHPQWWGPALLDPCMPWRDKIRAASLGLNVMCASDRQLEDESASVRDRSAADCLAELDFSKEAMERFFLPFFGGVFLDRGLRASAGLFRYYLKKFLRGRAFIPPLGIAEFPRALAATLPPGAIRYNMRVRRVLKQDHCAIGVELDNGETINTRNIVLATDEPSTAALLPGDCPPPRPGRGTTVVYFSATRPFYTGALIVLPRASRRAAHFTDVTNVSPCLAPAGKRLISSTVLDEGECSDGQLFEETAADIAACFPAARDALEPLKVIRVPYALIEQPPSFRTQQAYAPTIEGVVLAGDQASSSSIQGAMRSGVAAAQRLLS